MKQIQAIEINKNNKTYLIHPDDKKLVKEGKK